MQVLGETMPYPLFKKRSRVTDGYVRSIMKSSLASSLHVLGVKIVWDIKMPELFYCIRKKSGTLAN